MAMDTMVNGQITDAVTQANLKVLGEAPAIAMGNLYQATSQALGNAAHNATFAQQQTNMVAQASTTQGINLIYGANTATEGAVAEKINQSDLPAMIASLKTVLESFKPVK